MQNDQLISAQRKSGIGTSILITEFYFVNIRPKFFNNRSNLSTP